MAKNKKIRTPVLAEIDRLVKVEAGFRCSVHRCGSTSGLEIHHINGDPSNHDPANLLVLCAVCHARTTNGEIDRKSCKMIKQSVSMQHAPAAELQAMKDDIIFEMRNLVGIQSIARPLVEKEKGTQAPDLRVDAAAGQAITFDKANVPLPVDTLRSLAYSLYRSSEFGGALAIQRLVMRTSDVTARDYSNLGALLDETECKEEAEEAYRKAIHMDPEDAVAWSNIGNLLRKTCRLEEAEQALHKAVVADEKFAAGWFNLGVLLSETGRNEAAEEAYRKAVAADPKYAIAWSNLGNLLKETGRPTDAEQAYREAVAADPKDAVAWSNLGNLLDETGRKEDAEQAYRKAVAADPKNMDWRNNFAYWLWENGHAEQAEVEALEALRLDPDCSYAHATFGLLQFEKNDLDAGLASYRHAMKTCPDDLDLSQKFHYEYGRALARAERTDEARRELEAALKIDSTFVPSADIEAELAKLG